MTPANDHPGITSEERHERRGFVGISVGLTVPVQGHLAIRRINGGEVHPTTQGLGFFRSLQVPGPLKPLAAGHPFPGLPLSENNPIEDLPVGLLERNGRTTALLEIRKADPCGECFFSNVSGEGHRLEIGPRFGEFQDAAGYFGFAAQVSGNLGTFQFFEIPLEAGQGCERPLG